MARKLTQAGLGELVGASYAAVSTWELEASEPDLDTIWRLARALGREPEWLLFGSRPIRAAEHLPDVPDILRRYRLEQWERAGRFAAEVFAAAVEAQRRELEASMRETAPAEVSAVTEFHARDVTPPPSAAPPPPAKKRRRAG